MSTRQPRPARRAGPAVRRALLIVAGAFALGALVAAQQPSADQPAFRTGADLVIVDAVVVDKTGRQIRVKFGAANRTQAVAQALRHRIIR